MGPGGQPVRARPDGAGRRVLGPRWALFGYPRKNPVFTPGVPPVKKPPGYPRGYPVTPPVKKRGKPGTPGFYGGKRVFYGVWVPPRGFLKPPRTRGGFTGGVFTPGKTP